MSAQKQIVLATVTAVVSGGVKLRFDGEAAAREKTYNYAGAAPVGGDRVCVVPISGTYVVLGAVGASGGGGGGASSDGWISGGTWSYVTATTITVPDGTKFRKGMALKLTQSTVKYFYVVGVSGNTLTITGGDDYTLANAAITDNYYSLYKPADFPNWFNYTPTWYCAGSMVYTASIVYAAFMLDSDTATVMVSLSGDLSGTASKTIYVSCPFTPYYASLTPVPGYGWLYDGDRLAPIARVDNTPEFNVMRYNYTVFPLGSGRSFGIGATFKIA